MPQSKKDGDNRPEWLRKLLVFVWLLAVIIFGFMILYVWDVLADKGIVRRGF